MRVFMVIQAFTVASAPIEWEEHYVGTETNPRTRSFFTWECLESLRCNKVGLKGPTEMPLPSGKGRLRKEIQFYAKVRPFFSFPGYKTRYDDVNLIIIRENTQGEYSGIEHQVSISVLISLYINFCINQEETFQGDDDCTANQVVKAVMQSLEIITHEASSRIAEYAFHYAKTQGRKKVSAIHKSNIMQKTDGLFLKVLLIKE